jgi:hypothetical protein
LQSMILNCEHALVPVPRVLQVVEIVEKVKNKTAAFF